MNTLNSQRDGHWPKLPKQARLAINRCNLPAKILGSLSFQSHPASLQIDGIEVLHPTLFSQLDTIEQPQHRAQYFMDYMVVRFRLDNPEEIGFNPRSRIDRRDANYIKVIKGWFFDASSRDAAVLKGWVESRFGLTPRYHHAPINDLNDDVYRRFNQERAEGLYNTNALEAQLDLLYSYTQYELARQHPTTPHQTLYRGSNHLAQFPTADNNEQIILLNNINAFSLNPERADEFGDKVIKIAVPNSKIFLSSTTLPGLLSAEEEVLVLGGLYRYS